jgi:hypothetical protein
VGKPIDDHFLMHYRTLLDAEDVAFDALEHAAEDGDREHFTEELAAWQKARTARSHWLEHCDYDVTIPGRNGSMN